VPRPLVNEYTIDYDGENALNVVGIMEFRDGKVVRERIYFGEPWEPPAWRAQWVESMDEPAAASCEAVANQVRVALDGPHPSAELVPSPSGQNHGRPHLSCHLRAIPSATPPVHDGQPWTLPSL
jgi:hypothetical protein